MDVECKSWTRDEVLDEWALLRQQGHHAAKVAYRLGMTADALLQALTRAKRDGDPRARFDWVGYGNRKAS